MVASADVLETERLRMRAHRVNDLADCAAMWADPIVARHIGGKPATREEAWSKILRYAGLWSLFGFGYWAVEEKASGRFVGDVGFGDFKREMTPSLEGPEIGWVLAPWAHGAGFATEAAGAALAWADDHFDAVQTECIIHPENAASIRVAVKCGYREIGRADYKGAPLILFRR